MAVYKATYCDPFLNNVDIRVAVDSSDSQPCKWITCKVDSSNTKITGYKVRVLDNSNNQIFPSSLSNNGEGYISPVEELPSDSFDSFINSGYNGTILKIPFFQNYNYDDNAANSQMKLDSLNAVYYVPRYKADYSWEDLVARYRTPGDNDTIYLGGNAGTNVYSGTGDAVYETLMVGDTIVLLYPFGDVCDKGIFIVDSIVDENRLPRVTLKRFLNIGSESLNQHEVVVTKGRRHDVVYSLMRTENPLLSKTMEVFG